MKIDIILLASGNSVRFGSNKLLYKIDDRHMFEYALDNAMCTKNGNEMVDRVIIVSQYEYIREYCELHYKDQLIYVDNPHSEAGISHSIHLGLQASDSEHDALFMVCDQPYMKALTINNMINAYGLTSRGLACASYDEGRIMGNPCIFAPYYRTELMQLDGDRGGKRVIMKHMDDTLLYNVDDRRELEDIDYI